MSERGFETSLATGAAGSRFVGSDGRLGGERARLHPLQALSEFRRLTGVDSVDILSELHLAVWRDASRPVAQIHRDGGLQLDDLFFPRMHRFLDAFRRPVRLIAQHIFGELLGLFEPNAAVTERSA